MAKRFVGLVNPDTVNPQPYFGPLEVLSLGMASGFQGLRALRRSLRNNNLINSKRSEALSGYADLCMVHWPNTAEQVPWVSPFAIQCQWCVGSEFRELSSVLCAMARATDLEETPKTLSQPLGEAP